MAVSLSPISDGAIHKMLGTFYVEFRSGNKTALWSALYCCGMFQAVMPDWVVDALIEITNGIESGHVSDLNEAFGYEQIDRRIRSKALRERKLKMDVTHAIYHRNIQGKGIDNELFEEIGNQFGLSLRQTRECYKAGLKLFPKEQWKKLEPGETVGTSNLKVSIERRKGRSIL